MCLTSASQGIKIPPLHSLQGSHKCPWDLRGEKIRILEDPIELENTEAALGEYNLPCVNSNTLLQNRLF